MAINPLLLNVKPISEITTVDNPIKGHLLFYDGSDELKKVDIVEFQSLIGGIAKPLAISDASPTVSGWYKPTTVGTYANAGGLVAQVGYDTLFYFDGTTWSLVSVYMTTAETIFSPNDNVKIASMKATADYMPLYETGKNKLNKATFVDNTILTKSGDTFTQSPWKTTGFLEVPSSTEISIKDARFFAQYDINKVFIPGTFVDNTTQGNLTLTTNASTVYFKQTVLDTKINTASVELGAAVTAYESYRITLSKRKGDNVPLKFAPLMDSTASAELEPFTLQSRLIDYILGESYTVSSATYTDGIIKSPVTVGYPDGATGTLTITRNADMAVTKIVATHIKGSVTTSVTINITRNSDNNVTLITIS